MFEHRFVSFGRIAALRLTCPHALAQHLRVGPAFHDRERHTAGLREHAHGRALVGRLGTHDLAVVDLYGPVVNLAFRLEEMTKAYGAGIVVSDEVAQKLRRVLDPANSGK